MGGRNIESPCFLQARRRRGLEEKSAEEVEQEIRDVRLRRKVVEKRGTAAQRFARLVRATVVEGMKSTIQAMFYAMLCYVMLCYVMYVTYDVLCYVMI